MRIIAGDYKGRRLQSPQDYSIRPTTDKVKEALFSILTEKIWGSRVLDLFAGTGNLGIEALSRGAETCVFADSSRESLRLIRENIAHCKAEEGARVEAGDYRKILGNQTEPFDIILLDPPYNKGLLDECFRLIAENDLLAEAKRTTIRDRHAFHLCKWLNPAYNHAIILISISRRIRHENKGSLYRLFRSVDQWTL